MFTATAYLLARCERIGSPPAGLGEMTVADRGIRALQLTQYVLALTTAPSPASGFSPPPVLRPPTGCSATRTYVEPARSGALAFDFAFNPKLPWAKLVELATARFIASHQGVLLIGP